ncbi:S1C family serine protease [Mesomycoplasma hyopneumoniae]|uniref:S1C family serine protease n=1 Tax=Mesomycoplasma hyopneumoniae TaxID=2099 RepID=UPI003DA240F4
MKKFTKKYGFIGLFLALNLGILLANVALLTNNWIKLNPKVNLESLLKSIVEIKIQKNEEISFATGFVIDNKIITNKHIIENSDEIDIFYRLANEKDYKKTRIIKISQNYDILSLQLNTQVKNLEIEENFNYADEIFTIGNPHNLGLTISKGIISGTNKLANQNFVRTSITIEPGNSGGPVLNTKNKVIGIMTLAFINEKPVQGISFFLPSSQIKEFLNSN